MQANNVDRKNYECTFSVRPSDSMEREVIRRRNIISTKSNNNEFIFYEATCS